MLYNIPGSTSCKGKSWKDFNYPPTRPRSPKLARWRPLRLATRLLAAVPPLGLAFYRSDLTFILRVCGTLGFIVAFTVPAVLLLASEKRCRAEGVPLVTTFFPAFLTSRAFAQCVLVGSLAFFLLNIYHSFADPLPAAPS